MALNSRCTSDYTGNQKYHHWGMFDKTKRLTDEQTKKRNQLIATNNSLASEPCKEEFAYALDRALNGRGQDFPVIVLFLGGIILMSLGLIGEYLGRIYLTINKKKSYTIKEEISSNKKVSIDLSKQK